LGNQLKFTLELDQSYLPAVLKGLNENTNGLVRQYIPKSRSLETVTPEELQMIEDKLNNRPRKCLGFQTPNQVFNASMKRRALRA
jgi:transposase, IS30 family